MEKGLGSRLVLLGPRHSPPGFLGDQMAPEMTVGPVALPLSQHTLHLSPSPGDGRPES